MATDSPDISPAPPDAASGADPPPDPRTSGEVAEELVAQVRAGVPGAWEELVRTYGRLAYTVPREMGLSDADCEDVFQATWVSLWRQLPLLRQPAGLGGWLATTARRHASELIRQRGRRVERERQGARGEIATDPSPARSASDLELKRLVDEAVVELSERCQLLLRRLDLSSKPESYSDLADELGIPRGTIGPTRLRCLERLARILERKGLR